LVAAVGPPAGGPAGVAAPGHALVVPLAGGLVVPLAGGPVAVAGPPHALAATVTIVAAAVSAKARRMWFMVFFFLPGLR
jgi:hypothetical protein